MTCDRSPVSVFLLAADALATDEAGAATEHLERCPRCARATERARLLLGKLSPLPGELPPLAPALRARLLAAARAKRAAPHARALPRSRLASSPRARQRSKPTCPAAQSAAAPPQELRPVPPGPALRIALRCTYCHDRIARSDPVFCAACMAPHHADCFVENARCAAPGCAEALCVRPSTRPSRASAARGATGARPRPSDSARAVWGRGFALGALVSGGAVLAALAAHDRRGASALSAPTPALAAPRDAAGERSAPPADALPRLADRASAAGPASDGVPRPEPAASSAADDSFSLAGRRALLERLATALRAKTAAERERALLSEATRRRAEVERGLRRAEAAARRFLAAGGADEEVRAFVASCEALFPHPRARLERALPARVDFSAREVSLAEAAEAIARQTGCVVRVSRGFERRLTVALRSARCRPALEILAERAGAELRSRPGGAFLLVPRPRVRCAFDDEPLGDALARLADFGDRQLISSPGLRGTVSLRLRDVPWPRALEALARSAHLDLRVEERLLVATPRPPSFDSHPNAALEAAFARLRARNAPPRLRIEFRADALPLVELLGELEVAAGRRIQLGDPSWASLPVRVDFAALPWSDALRCVADFAGLEVYDQDDGSVLLGDPSPLTVDAYGATARDLLGLLARAGGFRLALPPGPGTPEPRLELHLEDFPPLRASEAVLRALGWPFVREGGGLRVLAAPTACIGGEGPPPRSEVFLGGEEPLALRLEATVERPGSQGGWALVEGAVYEAGDAVRAAEGRAERVLARVRAGEAVLRDPEGRSAALAPVADEERRP